MTELPLDDYQRDPFAGHLDCVSVAELARREPSPDAGRPSGVSQQRADPGRGAGTAAGGSTEHAEQRADRQPRADLEPRLELLPGPTVHSNLAALAALPRRINTAPRVLSRSLSAKASASLTLNPARQSTTMTPRSLSPSGRSPAARITAMISSTVGGSGG